MGVRMAQLWQCIGLSAAVKVPSDDQLESHLVAPGRAASDGQEVIVVVDGSDCALFSRAPSSTFGAVPRLDHAF